MHNGLSKAQRWRGALSSWPVVAEALRPDYPVMLGQFPQARRSALSRRIKPVCAAAT